MNTITLISLIIAAVVIVSANAIPTPQKLSHGESYLLVQEPEDGIQEDSEEFAIEEEGKGNRFRRATCDLLSISLPWGSLNHSACAAHCIAMRKGFKGGRCRDGVCHCRR